MERDLFGNKYEPEIVLKKGGGKYQKWRHVHNYRLATGKDKCKTCDNSRRLEWHGKVYYKCMLQGVSNSEASDIILKMVCNKHEDRKED